MTILEAGIKKEEIQLPNKQKLLIEYGIDDEEYPVPADSEDVYDMKIANYRRLSLFDESGKLIGTIIEENPHQAKGGPGIDV